MALTDSWVADAEILLAHGRWHAAYYLLGYAVECGLKVCVLKEVEEKGLILKDRRLSEKCFTHHFESLLRVANLEARRGLDSQANLRRESYWELLERWSVDARYLQFDEPAARALHEAVTHPTNGILIWIKANW